MIVDLFISLFNSINFALCVLKFILIGTYKFRIVTFFFLMNSLMYHFEMFLFISGNILCLQVYFDNP